LVSRSSNAQQQLQQWELLPAVARRTTSIHLCGFFVFEDACQQRIYMALHLYFVKQRIT
jgi:hypothetical protein